MQLIRPCTINCSISRGGPLHGWVGFTVAAFTWLSLPFSYVLLKYSLSSVEGQLKKDIAWPPCSRQLLMFNSGCRTTVKTLLVNFLSSSDRLKYFDTHICFKSFYLRSSTIFTAFIAVLYTTCCSFAFNHRNAVCSHGSAYTQNHQKFNSEFRQLPSHSSIRRQVHSPSTKWGVLNSCP